ncbi:hypothetical protein NX784_18330 [Massilia pinisoli]|uniref:Uncharacterized protein n=1 Tax=Massilia pinisoli TaxID=1772194 RepID=A0ABT1ZUD7_9BURK|nr:hypothetical protein [Massilia pinisoli]MCS0583552.1 hypothetical protein [Massilia pinisoli]
MRNDIAANRISSKPQELQAIPATVKLTAGAMEGFGLRNSSLKNRFA